MGDFDGEAEFLLEAIDNRGVASQFRPDDLKRNQAIQLAILRFVDRAHTAGTEDGEDFVAAGEDRSRRQLDVGGGPSCAT
jgi:hypothetical protein